MCQKLCNRCGQSRDREWPLKIKDVDRCQRDNKKTLKLILKREEEVCKVWLARCCDGDFTPALSTSWQVWTKTSVGGVFTITNGKMFAIIDSKKDLLKSQLYLITLPSAFQTFTLPTLQHCHFGPEYNATSCNFVQLRATSFNFNSMSNTLLLSIQIQFTFTFTLF